MEEVDLFSSLCSPAYLHSFLSLKDNPPIASVLKEPFAMELGNLGNPKSDMYQICLLHADPKCSSRSIPDVKGASKYTPDLLDFKCTS